MTMFAGRFWFLPNIDHSDSALVVKPRLVCICQRSPDYSLSSKCKWQLQKQASVATTILFTKVWFLEREVLFALQSAFALNLCFGSFEDKRNEHKFKIPKELHWQFS